VPIAVSEKGFGGKKKREVPAPHGDGSAPISVRACITEEKTRNDPGGRAPWSAGQREERGSPQEKKADDEAVLSPPGGHRRMELEGGRYNRQQQEGPSRRGRTIKREGLRKKKAPKAPVYGRQGRERSRQISEKSLAS